MSYWNILALALVVVMSKAVAADDDDPQGDDFQLDDIPWDEIVSELVPRDNPQPEVVLPWNDLGSDTLNVDSNGCATTEFFVKEKSTYELSLEAIDLPSECSLKDDFRTTTRMHFMGECLVRKSDDKDKCAKPSKVGIKGAHEMCENWSVLDTAPFQTGRNETTVSNMTGLLCVKKKTYYLSIKSSCPRTTKFRVQVHRLELSAHGDNVLCHLIRRDFRAKARDYDHDVLIVVFVVLPIVCIVIVGGIVICCCFCPGCPCYFRRHKPNTVAQPIDQYPGKPYPGQPASDQSVPVASDEGKVFGSKAQAN